MKREGVLFVVSAPSGAGKTTLCKRMIDIFPNLGHSVSFTTRPMRGGETDGVDYHFVSVDTFRRMIDDNAFVEWAQVHDNYYGTALKTLEDARLQGHDVLLDIDFQGAAQLKKQAAEAVFVFIAPPDMDELERRLRQRGTDSDAVISRRLDNAAGELREAQWYDYIVINDDIDHAAKQLQGIIEAETCRGRHVYPFVEQMIARR
ncbi:guanylate kinase [Desulfuromonas acetoxidans]|uniref:Guanylate kinase n=1 Tax=Desulfuromonas acetoxidans (strain DSM 684 / 11070) TaxID=281689 RepID=Q1JWM9_DESA6|nr:guanylate kinase [Desulfuromonas acetoxidans]EAT14650.1 Guanylate kinase [Desulfuromonas acetoxidans DSM 684]MBF0645059.1 guanylate kinase [Desulfuromonas acetoxidans]NVD23132.1 guanylate kinase [Desulfuromonas acetoxidans]NVE15627.1 guanylate kinase [Desulfuromonas acetoxidans]